MRTKKYQDSKFALKCLQKVKWTNQKKGREYIKSLTICNFVVELVLNH